MRKKMGYHAKDLVTGFQGIITGFARYITGCDQVCLTPPVKGDGTVIEGRWFDTNRIKLMSDKPEVKLDTKEDKGGPSPSEQARVY